MVKKLFLFALLCFASVKADPDRWWKSANIYQISPVSFKDSNNDGFGDVGGIISKLDYIEQTGFDVIFLAPFYKTPFVDFAYDVASYTEIDPRFGAMNDVDVLLLQAKQRGLKVIIDFIPNHTSYQHDWFVKSEAGERGYENFYVWHDGAPAGDGNLTTPPNNWQSVYGESSWEWSEKRQQYFYHAFAKQQPDLNLREQRVIDELDGALKFWLAKGVDGFRIDAVSQLFEDPAFLENPETANNLPQTYELVERWRKLIDDFTAANGGDNRVLVPQVWDSSLAALMAYYEGQNQMQRAQAPTNFILINKLNRDSNADDYKSVIDSYLDALPDGAVANWFVSSFLDFFSNFNHRSIFQLGTHDHSRVASRMGTERIDALTLLLLTLPGIAFTYNGDEIGMSDHRGISWEDTTDPWACNADPETFHDLSRDPSRTPFQWDDSANAGFNDGGPTWIPVHPDYAANNLALQQSESKSFYKFYRTLAELRKNEIFVDGTFESKALNENVFAYRRTFDDSSFAILINLSDNDYTLDVNDLNVEFSDRSEVVLAGTESLHEIG